MQGREGSCQLSEGEIGLSCLTLAVSRQHRYEACMQAMQVDEYSNNVLQRSHGVWSSRMHFSQTLNASYRLNADCRAVQHNLSTTIEHKKKKQKKLHCTQPSPGSSLAHSLRPPKQAVSANRRDRCGGGHCRRAMQQQRYRELHLGFFASFPLTVSLKSCNLIRSLTTSRRGESVRPSDTATSTSTSCAF